MNTNGDREEREGDGDIARLLGALGPRESLPDELKDRWEAAFRAELASARRLRRVRRLMPFAALAASAAGILVLAVLLQRPGEPSAGPSPMTLVALSGSVEVHTADRQSLVGSTGLNLQAGTLLETGADSLAGVDWAGFDVRLNERTRVRLQGQQLELERGELYVSSPGENAAPFTATILTPLATVRDIGTQFKVRYDGLEVTTSVREGVVEVVTPVATQRAQASPERGHTLLVRQDGEVQVSEDVSDWSWVTSAGRPFELEGRSLLEFLNWAAGESGRELRFVDSAAELSAGYTRFSGAIDLKGLDPEEAVELVLSTTRFEARAEDGALLVSRRSE